MTNQLLLLIPICLIAFSCKKTDTPIPSVAAGSIERVASFTSDYVDARTIDIWLPETYDGRQPHCVLYMHDGQMLFDSTTTWNGQEWMVDEVMSRLIREKSVKPCIVVGIWNNGEHRHSEYFPEKPFQSLPAAFRDSLLNEVNRGYSNPMFTKNIQSDNYLKFITGELKPYIDQKYTTNPGREHTFIAGSSMGGLISLYAVSEYPEVFGGAACLSTHWVGIFTTENNPIPDTFLHYMSTNLPDPSTHKLYFDYGTETLDSLYEPFQLKADSVIKTKGYTRVNWITRKFPGDDHSERSWSNRLHIPLEFLSGNND